MNVHLVAVQAEIHPEAYRSAETFQERVLKLTQQAVQDLPEDEARVVAFPEAFALPLLFWLDTPEETLDKPSALEAALFLLGQRWREALRYALRQGVPPLRVFYHLRGLEVWPVYERVFREAARAARAYLVAGSLFAPIVDWEPARGYHARSREAHNLTLVLNPQGTILARVPKIHLTLDERKSLLAPGPYGTQVVQTRIGKLATLICLDAFHETLIEQADAAGAWLLIQPSANAARWRGPWSANPREEEGTVWLREGLTKKLEGREHLRYGINPMLNGRFYGLYFEGQSSIATAGQLLQIASHPTGDALLRAQVALDW
nr:nitrilase-related carbon-nitrogen hydrolase [Marinithermus hydrothermalis]